MRRSTLLTAAAIGLIAAMFICVAQPRAWGHCEIPCGIYGDHARIDQMLEDTTTIAKAVDQINALARKRDALSINQLTRWVANKDEHATRIQDTIAQYFLNQRVKPAPSGSPGYDDYVTRLIEHHAVMVAAMKTKQTVDPTNVERLREAVETIGAYYPGQDTHPTTAPSRR